MGLSPCFGISVQRYGRLELTALSGWRRLAFDQQGEGEFWRGDYHLAHQSQRIRRDLAGETILSYPCHQVHGYMKTDQQVEDCRTGKSPFLPYRYLLTYPESYTAAWIAFWGEKDLQAFVSAYGLKVLGDLIPGEPFEIKFPSSDKAWLPIRMAGPPASRS